MKESRYIPSSDHLIKYANSLLLDKLFKNKTAFALFYLDLIGLEHVMTVLLDSLKYGDLNVELLKECRTPEDVEKFINKKIPKEHHLNFD